MPRLRIRRPWNNAGRTRKGVEEGDFPSRQGAQPAARTRADAVMSFSQVAEAQIVMRMPVLQQAHKPLETWPWPPGRCDPGPAPAARKEGWAPARQSETQKVKSKLSCGAYPGNWKVCPLAHALANSLRSFPGDLPAPTP